jgi:hypothetical protein
MAERMPRQLQRPFVIPAREHREQEESDSRRVPIPNTKVKPRRGPKVLQAPSV